MAEWLRPFVSPGGVFIDLGGGTGDLGAGVARALDARVVIVDPTPQMLARAPAQPLLSVRLGAAEADPVPGWLLRRGPLSPTLSTISVTQDSAAREMRRAVRPGGGVVILEMEGSGWGRLLSAVERLVGEPGDVQDPGRVDQAS